MTSRAAMEGSPIVWAAGSDPLSLTHLGVRWAERTGLSVRSSLGARWLDAVHPDDRERCAAARHRAAESAAPFEIEYRLRVAGAGHRPVVDRAEPSLDDAGRATRWFGTLVDVEPPEAASREAPMAHDPRRWTEAQLRRFSESGVLGINFAHLNGDIRFANDEYLRIIGYTREELERGRIGWKDLTPPSFREIDERAVAEAHARGACGPYEKQYIRKDGSRIWVLVGVSLLDWPGEGGDTVAFVLDITERKRAADALRESEERLRQEDRRKDEFLAVLAHELRNPLAPIQSSLELLRMSPTPDALERARARMERQLHQLVRLVDDLLDISRIRTGKIRLQLAPADLTAVVRTAVEACEAAIREAGHSLTVTGLTEPLPLFADPARLVQVVSNLLTNAIKYTPRGGRVTVDVRREGSFAALRVADTGIGIPASMLARVFDLFTQVDTEHTRAGSGLGIGLSLVKSLVEHHGGQVSAASDGPGRGSELTVRLPLSAEPTASPESPAPRKRGAAPLRIVVVEDNVDAADALALLLEVSGHHVVAAYDGPSGLAAIRSERPDLVLLDIGLPEMDGYAVARAVRERDTAVFIAALSGWGQEEDRERSREAGFDVHMVKPVAPEDLSALLARVAACRRDP